VALCVWERAECVVSVRKSLCVSIWDGKTLNKRMRKDFRSWAISHIAVLRPYLKLRLLDIDSSTAIVWKIFLNAPTNKYTVSAYSNVIDVALCYNVTYTTLTSHWQSYLLCSLISVININHCQVWSDNRQNPVCYIKAIRNDGHPYYLP